MDDLHVPHPDDVCESETFTHRQVNWVHHDEMRINAGLAPIHPELAKIWPHVYNGK